jgi:hypothetical protein
MAEGGSLAQTAMAYLLDLKVARCQEQPDVEHWGMRREEKCQREATLRYHCLA